VIGALALVALALPAGAQAHTASASVSCTGADFTFTNFQPGSNTVHWSVLVDTVEAAHGDFVLDQAGGAQGALHVPLTIYGNHAVTANAWWGPVGTVNGQTRSSESPPLASANVECAAAPIAPAPAPVAAPVAAVSVSAPPAPAIQVEAAHASAPSRVARLAVASVCSSQIVRVAVNGTAMRDVALSVNGRHVKTLRVNAATRKLRTSVPVPRKSRALVVTARVRFRNGAQARTISAPARRCAAVAVQPQFTG
jgi:hypothetical protein